MYPSVQHDDTRFLDLLRRWQSGDFTRADEQELNALVASDDFRRETLEGFMSLPEAAHDDRLAALRVRLRDRTGGRRLISMPQIWAAAAALVLLLAAILFFQKWEKKQDAPIAQTQTESLEKSPALESAPFPEMPENERPDEIASSSKPVPSASGPSQPPADDQILAAPGNSAASGEIAAVEDAKVSEQEAQSGYTTAPPQAPNAAPMRQARDEAYDKAASETKKDNMATTPAARAQDAAKAKKSKERSRTADSTWHETDRKPDMAAAKKEAREKAQPEQSEPEGGWEAFGEYLRLNARLTPEARNNNASGTVRLQFSLNANGDPQGFVVLRPLGYGCDQEAIRLAQAWEWVRGKDPVVTVEVPFVR